MNSEMVVRFDSDPPIELKRKLFDALGEIVYEMGYLERSMHRLLRSMLHNEKLASLLVFGVHLDKMLDALRAGFYSERHHMYDTLVFEHLIDRVLKVHEYRNDNIHAQWLITPKGIFRGKWTKHSKGVLSFSKSKSNFPISELYAVSRDTRKVTQDIDLFKSAVFDKQIPEGKTWNQLFDAYAKLIDKAKAASPKKSRKRNPPKK